VIGDQSWSVWRRGSLELVSEEVIKEVTKEVLKLSFFTS